MAKIIGIDLGTTNSCVSVLEGDKPKVIENSEGDRTTPSIIAYTDDETLVGQSAKRQAVTNPENTLFAIKRLIGRKFSDKSVQADKKLVPYEIISDKDKPVIRVTQSGKKTTFAPEEVSAMVLQKMKITAETFLGKEINNAVLAGNEFVFQMTALQNVETLNVHIDTI